MKTRQESLNEMIQLAARSRGYVIELSISIERAIDRFIAGYFCEDSEKFMEIKDYIIAQAMPAESKRMIFVNILRRNYPNLLKINKKTLDSIAELYDERNVLAHMELDVSDDALDIFIETGDIHFIKYRTQVSQYPYNNEKVETTIKNCLQYLNALSIIFENSIGGHDRIVTYPKHVGPRTKIFQFIKSFFK